MLKLPKKILVALLLILLQFAVPFLHAHSGVDRSPSGLHIPGLEYIGNYSPQPELSNVAFHFSIDGVIVGIGSGLHYAELCCPPLTEIQCLLETVSLFGDASGHHPVNFSPQTSSAVPRRFYLAPAPRAPPL